MLQCIRSIRINVLNGVTNKLMILNRIVFDVFLNQNIVQKQSKIEIKLTSALQKW